MKVLSPSLILEYFLTAIGHFISFIDLYICDTFYDLSVSLNITITMLYREESCDLSGQ